MAGLTKLPQGPAAYNWDLPAQAGPEAPSAQPSSLGDQLGAQLTTLDRMLSTPNAMPPGRMPPVAPNPWREVQSFVGKTMAVVMAPIDILNQAAASLTFPLAMMLPAFPAVRLFADLTLTVHVHPHPPTFGIPIPAVGPCVAAGACSVLINGLPSARSGDFGLSAWCGGYFPVFEVVTGSSHCMIQGARPARVTDITLHCTKTGQMGAIGVGMMMFSAAMGVVGIMAAETDQANAIAADAAAAAAAATVEASTAALQLAADCAAMALSVMMGMDPAPPPAIGMFITGSPNVLIGGFPMPGWMLILKGLQKILRLIARAIQLRLPAGGRLRNALCTFTGHPVDVATGRVVTSVPDFEIKGIIPVVFERAYDSLAREYAGPLGRGWTHSFDLQLWEDDDQRMVVLRDSELNHVGFELLEPGTTTYNSHHHLWLEHRGDKDYVVRDTSGLQQRFGRIAPADAAAWKTAFDPLRLTHIEDRNGNRISLRYTRGVLEQIEDPVGRQLRFIYTTMPNGDTRLSDVWLLSNQRGSKGQRLANYSYSADGNLVTASDSTSATRRYAYEENRLTRETDRNGISFYFQYDEDGRCIRTWGDGDIYLREFTYDVAAECTTATDGYGNRTQYHWNDLGLVTSEIDSLGGEKTFEWDQNGNKKTETNACGERVQFEYNEFGLLSSVKDPLGNCRRMSYDSSGRPTMLVDEVGATGRREYDDRGNVVAVTDPSGGRWEYRPNARGLLECATDPKGGQTLLRWDSKNNLTAVVDRNGSETQLVHDALGRMIRRREPSGAEVTLSWDPVGRLRESRDGSGRTLHFVYDEEGNLVRATDSLGRTRRYRYGALGRLLQVQEPGGQTTRYRYNKDGDLVAVHDHRAREWSFELDAEGNVRTDRSCTGRRLRYEYDAASRMLSVSNALDQRTEFHRDAAGRITRRVYFDGSEEHFEYDPRGLLIKAEGPSVIVTRQYDASGRITAESIGDQRVENAYDPIGNRITRKSPYGRTVDFTYEAEDRLELFATSDGRNVSFNYDALGRETRRTLPSGVFTERTWTPPGDLLSSQTQRQGRVILGRKYKYDAAGQLESIWDHRSGTTEFTHDLDGRLATALHPEHALERFLYDAAGDVPGLPEQLDASGTDTASRRVGDWTLWYDRDGKLIEKSNGTVHYTFEYDGPGRLFRVASSDHGTSEYSYDPLGRRLTKTTALGTTWFFWDGDTLLGERSQATKEADSPVEYLFRPGTFEPVAVFDSEVAYFLECDHLGSAIAATDIDGRVVWDVEYGAFGNVRRENGQIGLIRFRFPGQYADDESGLYYNRFRYYDPDLRIYTSPDPLGFFGGLNTYNYVSNPTNWVDPYGLGPLLPGEGQVGTYDDLIAAGRRGDNLTPHHVPSDTFMRQKVPGYSRGEGISIMMEQPTPGTGGRHRSTLSYGSSPDLTLSPREALAREVADVRRIYRREGLYTPEIQEALREIIRKNKQKWPNAFKRGTC